MSIARVALIGKLACVCSWHLRVYGISVKMLLVGWNIQKARSVCIVMCLRMHPYTLEGRRASWAGTWVPSSLSTVLQMEEDP